MTTITHSTTAELDAVLVYFRKPPKDVGVLESIVRHPVSEEREVLVEGELDTIVGFVGDNYSTPGSSITDDGNAHP